ncbi:heavy-metal-associated domain-containing protein [Trichloromonas sp.]|uniref:heavy-metal-associated domain-containing protein n=1 Tax=Trichloromonas sp. TaxID=3069249 RepID=UPI003D813178
MSRRGFMLVLVGVLVLFAGAFAFSGSGVKTESSVELQVGNLTCGACVEKIKGAVSDLDGIGGVEVDLASGLTRVSFDSSRTDAAAIAERIARAGYPVGPSAEGRVVPSTSDVRCPAAKPVSKSGCGGTCCG